MRQIDDLSTLCNELKPAAQSLLHTLRDCTPDPKVVECYSKDVISGWLNGKVFKPRVLKSWVENKTVPPTYLGYSTAIRRQLMMAGITEPICNFSKPDDTYPFALQIALTIPQIDWLLGSITRPSEGLVEQLSAAKLMLERE